MKKYLTLIPALLFSQTPSASVLYASVSTYFKSGGCEIFSWVQKMKKERNYHLTARQGKKLMAVTPAKYAFL